MLQMDNKSLIKTGNKSIGILNSFSNGSLPMPFESEIFLLKVKIAGLSYYELSQIKNQLKNEDRLILKREPNNKYDKLAIEVYYNKNIKLGYVPRNKNEVIARLMDAGKVIYGIINSFNLNEYNDYLEIDMDIFMKEY